MLNSEKKYICTCATPCVRFLKEAEGKFSWVSISSSAPSLVGRLHKMEEILTRECDDLLLEDEVSDLCCAKLFGRVKRGVRKHERSLHSDKSEWNQSKLWDTNKIILFAFLILVCPLQGLWSVFWLQAQKSGCFVCLHSLKNVKLRSGLPWGNWKLKGNQH